MEKGARCDMYSNEYIDTTEIDTDRLENDLYDYYGTGAFAVSPATVSYTHLLPQTLLPA